jgi:hypothetical protein
MHLLHLFLNIFMKMELFLRDNKEMLKVKTQFVKDLVFKYGLMEGNMKDIGPIIKLKEEENSTMLMEMFMMDSGSMTKPTVSEFILMLMVQNTKENGKKTNSTVMEVNTYQMVANTTENSD